MHRSNIILACLVALFLAPSANAEQLVDGGFEFGGVRLDYLPGTYNGTAEKLGTNPQDLGTGGWQVIDGTQPTYLFSVLAGDPATQDGSDQYVHIADGGTFGTIRQEFTTVIGQEYLLSLWSRLNCCGPADAGAAWELGGVTGGLVTSDSRDDSAWGDVFEWTQFTDTFIANDTSSYINLSNELSGMNFDNVSITEFTGTIEGTFEWSTDGPGNWNSAGNWNVNAGTPAGSWPNGNDDAIFGSTIMQGSTVFTDSDVTARSIQFDNANTYNVSGLGTVTIDQGTNSGGAISVVQGSHQFQAPVSLNHNTTVDVAASSTLDFNNQINLNTNTLDTSTSLGTVNFNNSVIGGGSITASAAVGTAGSTSIAADLTLSGASTLDIDLGNLNTDHFDVTGNVVLDALSVLDVTLEPGFVPSGSYTILTASGTLTDNGLTLDASDTGTFSLSVNSNTVVLTALAGLSGDFNGDNKVDGADFLFWQRNLGDATNLGIWQGNYGAGALAAAAGAAAVPEPTSMLMMLLATAPLMAGRRKERK